MKQIERILWFSMKQLEAWRDTVVRAGFQAFAEEVDAEIMAMPDDEEKEKEA
jgi:hypothetical protein